jgi:hypothetical protein
MFYPKQASSNAVFLVASICVSSYDPLSFRDHPVQVSTNVVSVHHSDKNRCTVHLSVRETLAAHATAVFAVNFFLDLDLKKTLSAT